MRKRSDTEKIAKALTSKTRRAILKILTNGPLNVKEIQSLLQKKNIELEYTQSVFKALQILTASGLVKKFYVSGKGICYKTASKEIKINFEKMD